jgi:hypothetical protein
MINTTTQRILDLAEVDKEIHSAINTMENLQTEDMRCRAFMLESPTYFSLGISKAGKVAHLLALYDQWKSEQKLSFDKAPNE